MTSLTAVLRASAIVPTFNRPAALERTLAALRAMDYPADGLQIVVVDSGVQGNGSEQIAVAHDAVYAHRSNDGVSASRNHGARLASGELLFFVDDDIVVSADDLGRRQAIHATHERCLVSGHWQFDPELRRRLEQTPLGRYRLAYEDLYNKPDGVGGEARSGQVNPRTLAAANLSLPAEVFRSLDGFDERFPVGAEDQDLTWRAGRAGCELIYDFGIRVIHNDQHADFAALCSRMERGAMGTVYFARKNPDAPAPPMLSLNGPVRAQDPPRAVARKLTRDLLSRRMPLLLAHRLVALAERVRPSGGRPLEFLYRAVGGLHVFRGVRRGLAATSGADWTTGHDA